MENKIPSISNLVKKTDYDTKVSEIEKNITDHSHDEYITTPEFNKLKLAQANLVTKTDFDNNCLVLNYRNTVLNKTRHLLNEKELKKIKNIWFGLFHG